MTDNIIVQDRAGPWAPQEAFDEIVSRFFGGDLSRSVTSRGTSLDNALSAGKTPICND